MYLVATVLCSIDLVSDLRRNLEELCWDNSEDRDRVGARTL